MTEQDYLLYSYAGNWNANILSYTQQFPYSLIFHPTTKRLIHNGVIYSDGRVVENGPYFIKGTNANDDATGAWEGTINGIEAYHEGLSIIFVPSCIGSTTQTTLNINNLGVRNCYFTNSNPVTQQYSIGTPILFTYVGTSADGYWKRADHDTTQTPVIQADGSSSNYYINLTSVTSGLADVQTIGSNLRYAYGTETLYCPNFNGNFTGNLTGVAQQASSLYPGRQLWGQVFDGTANVTGDISSTGNITPTTNDTSNIGTSLLKYTEVFAKYFRGRADGLKSHNYNSECSKIILLGQDEDVIGNDVATGTGAATKNQGLVYGKKTVYVTEQGLLHSNHISAGNNSAYDANYSFVSYGRSQFRQNLEVTQNANILISSGGHLGIGVSSMNGSSYAMRVYGDALFEGSNGLGQVTANGYHVAGLTNPEQYVILADGTTKAWDVWDDLSDTHVGLKLVSRDSNGAIYANRFFTDISEETLSTIGSVYVTNGSTDTAIRKVSLEAFASIVSGNNIIEITKSLQVTEAWMDTGITTDSTTFPGGNGTYIIQLDATSINNTTDLYPAVYSGVMTIYTGTNNNTESEEIILHRSGYGQAIRLYLRTMPTASSQGYNKIQIASAKDFTYSHNLVFRFKKMI